MRNNRVCGALAAVALMAASDGAYAATVQVDCSANPGALAALFANGGTANTDYVIAAGTCDGYFPIMQTNISISRGPRASVIHPSISGWITIGAANTSLVDLSIDGSVYVIGPASVTIQTCRIDNGSGDGVLADGPALVNISQSGVQNISGTGMWGNGLHARYGAVIKSTDVVITGNGGVGVLAEQNSTVSLFGATVTGPSDNHTVLVSQGSRAHIDHSTITADTPFNANNQFAVIAVEDSSTAVLDGDNIIANSASGGAAVMLSGGSTLKQRGTDFFVPNETIVGDGRIHTQSIIELGAAPGSGTLTWNGNIFLSQASSFRADGDNVTINGTLTLGQASNAYFNHSAGTSNVISNVQCNSTTDHVSNPDLVFPPVTIGPPPGCALF